MTIISLLIFTENKRMIQAHLIILKMIKHKNIGESFALKYLPYIFLGDYAEIGLIFAYFVEVISVFLK